MGWGRRTRRKSERAVAIASGKKVKPWYAKGKVCDEDDNDPDFKLSRVWKEYKKLAPTDPKRDRYDISKWSAEERSKSSFDSMDTKEY
ncbi:hypothetical protein NLJ89_g5636 [Agrocybe chaxingu]|uniref:Uncharacterized protein n=1 Tax=Agrocybe chaxingu TaxID=84603 RepID=A0A9W8JY41_9AGAR|nr:hypothetical protein NLJ89_g5636 [Agrocybe chaxingu]